MGKLAQSLLHPSRILFSVVVLTCLTGCGGGGGTPPPPPPAVQNPAPTVTSVSPSSVIVGGQGFTLSVNGSNFISNSVVQFNGVARTTTFVSSSQLQISLTAADIATAALNKVTVSNPAPGGGTSASIDFAVNNPLPTVASLNPTFIPQGNAGFTLTVTGTGFVSTSTVQLNGSARPTTFVSDTTLQASLSAADASATGVDVITVASPAPGGGASNAQNFTITIPAPAITLVTPGSAVAGGADFTLTVSGTGFRAGATVLFNGTALTTTFVSETELQAQVTAAQIASTGAVNITVANPITTTAAPGLAAVGPTSNSFSFFTGTTAGAGFAFTVISQASRDIALNPAQHVIYASVPGATTTAPGAISVINLSTASVSSSQATGPNPGILSISDDSQFLYAGIDGASSIQRFALPGLTTDISVPLGADPFFGPFFAEDLQVAPGAAHTIAVTLANAGVSPAEQGGIVVFDDAVQRPTKAPGGSKLYRSLQWGGNTATLLASEAFGSYDTLTVDASGVSPNQSFSGVANGSKIHFDRATGRVYAESGQALGALDGVLVANFNAFGPIAVDANLNAAFFVTQSFFGSGTTLNVYDLTHFTLVRSVPVPVGFGTPRRLLRWGQNGLAFNTDSGQIVILGGNLLDPVTTPFTPPPPPPPVPPAPAPNAPVISALSPASAIAASPAFTLTVNGSNFDPAAQVQFNGSSRTTTFISSTQLQAAITAGDIAQIGVASITVANPVVTGGVSAPESLMIGSSGAAGFATAIINTPSNDLVYDRAHQAIYLSVPNSVASGNSISVLDLASLTISGEQFAGSNPHVLAISDDDQFLYTGVDGTAAVQRFTLPALTPDMQYPLGSNFFGPFFALDLQVAPGAPHTSAVTLGTPGSSPSALGGITIFDDASARPTIAKGFGPGGGGAVLYDSLQWGADANTLLAANNEDSGADFYTLTVDPTGVTLKQDFPSTFRGARRIHFDLGSNLVYADDGRVVDPATGLYAGIFQTTGVMVPDSSLNTAFFLTQPFGGGSVTIQAFDLIHFLPAGSITIPNVNGNARRLIRWGQNGLAFNTDAGQVILVAGSFVSPLPTAFPPPVPLPTPPAPPTPTAQSPVIASLNPSSAVVGGPAFTLTVNGTNFDPAAVVQFNGSPRTTTFVSSTQLQAAITAGDIANTGTSTITVANPVANGGVSAGSTFFIGAQAGSGFAFTIVNQPANDMVFAPLHDVILFSVPSTAAAHGNTVSALDLATGNIISSQFAGSEPDVLALSGDEHFLYAGIDGSTKVQRFTLPDFTPDISFLLGSGGFITGPNVARDIQVAPGAPNTVAVMNTQSIITVFDDATPRTATVNGSTSMQWGTDASTLFSPGSFNGDLLAFSASPAGLALNHDFPDAIGNFGRIHFDPGTKLIYSDDGHVVDPVSGLPVAVFQASGVMVPDSSLNVAFFVTSQFGSGGATIQAFDMTHFTLIGSVTVPNVLGNPKKLIRWGQNGLAFNTDQGQIVLLGGTFVSPVSTATPPATPLPTPPAPPTPTAQSPVITNLKPSSAIAGGAGFTLVVNGQNFDPAAVVEFNGSPRTTTFVSSTQLQAAIPAGDIANPGAATITVANPVANGGTSAGSSFFTGAAGGSGFAFTAISIPANDLLFDPFHQVILLSVASTAASRGNTISALDPASGSIVSSQFAGSEPGLLSLSDDGQLLYAAINGAAKVQRFALPGLSFDANYSMGGSSIFSGLPTALDLQVAPGAPHTSAVVTNAANANNTTIFDDATPRTGGAANLNSIQWGRTASALFASRQFSSDLFTYSADATGLTQTNDFGSGITGRRIHFANGNGLLYTDGGRAIDPVTGLPAGLFQVPASALMVPDSNLNAAFFVTQQFGTGATIQAFDLTHFTPVASITIPNVAGTIKRLIRWGQNGLAFNTDAGQLYLVGADLVSPVPTSTTAPIPLATPPAPPAPGPLTPVIANLNPGSALTGSPDLTITVNGTNFLSSSVVDFNGSALATTFVSATQLQATVPAAQIVSAGASVITVVNPPANGGTSEPVTFYTGTTAGTGFAANSINLLANRIAYDSVHQVIFASSPSTAGSRANSISALDPASGSIVSSRFAGSEPDLLAPSADGHFLYAAIEGASRVQRYTLPDFAEDISYSLGLAGNSGPLNALDLQVAPGAPNTTAVSLANNNFGFVSAQGVAVFDDAIQRSNRTFSSASSIQWGADPTAIFGASSFGADLLIMTVDPTGVTQSQDFFSAFALFGSVSIHFDSGTKLVYGNDGHAVDPATGTVVGTFSLPSVSATNFMVPDSTLNRAFFLLQPQSFGAPATITIESFDLTTFAPLSTITIPNVNGTVKSFIRWGDNGLAFNTSAGEVHLIGGNFVR